jgi:hypothetical protein
MAFEFNKPKDTLEMVSVTSGKIQVHPDNARQGNLELIKESIRENGFYGAIVAQRNTGHILVGNHRFMAATEEGLTEVPVMWVDKNDDEARRLLLIDNRSSDTGTYDDEALAELLNMVRMEMDSLVGTGYADDDLDALLFGLDTTHEDLGELLDDARTPGEQASHFEAANIRSIILPYELEDYNVVVELLAKARGDLGFESNAQVVEKLLVDSFA